jgi:AraC-like DNA-binding protein
MKHAPHIDFAEFESYIHQKKECNGFHEVIRNHPEFGVWHERSLDIGHIRVYEHKANFKRPAQVKFETESTANQVHHCISLEGKMGAHFLNSNISANLSPQSFHQVFIPENDYLLGMGNTFTNVHIEIDRCHYTNLLSDSEEWSAQLKRKLNDQEMFYQGEHSLTRPMMQAIYEIFSSPLSGSLKKLLIEARVHELVALQLNQLFQPAEQNVKKSNEVIYAVHEYLCANFLHAHTLKDISRTFGINEFALKKGFRETFHTTVFDFIFEQRMEYARTQLLETKLSIHEVGSMVGYKYPNHFSTAFRKKFGVSPNSLKLS